MAIVIGAVDNPGQEGDTEDRRADDDSPTDRETIKRALLRGRASEPPAASSVIGALRG
jgi:hypothetical protein